jgi:hypothetical protein
VDLISDLTWRHSIPILMATPEKQPFYSPLVRLTLSLPPNFALHAGGYCCQIDYIGRAHFSRCVWMANLRLLDSFSMSGMPVTHSK